MPVPGPLERRTRPGLQEFKKKKKAGGGGCVEGVLIDSEQSPRVSRFCFSPQRSEGFLSSRPCVPPPRCSGNAQWG